MRASKAGHETARVQDHGVEGAITQCAPAVNFRLHSLRPGLTALVGSRSRVGAPMLPKLLPRGPLVKGSIVSAPMVGVVPAKCWKFVTKFSDVDGARRGGGRQLKTPDFQMEYKLVNSF